MPAALDWAADRLTVRVGPVELQPTETLIIALAFAVALASAFRLWRIAQRERLQPRLEAFRGGSAAAATGARPLHRLWYDWLGAAVAASPIVGRTRTAAIARGPGQRRDQPARRPRHPGRHQGLRHFRAGRAGLALPRLAPVARRIDSRITLARSVIVVAALALGWRLPDFVLGRLTARRRRHIEVGMPDALDLLVVCAEAGLSLDQSIDQVSRELRFSHPEVAEEFAITAAEMRVMEDRGAALENLVRRTHLEILRGVTATLTQAIRFGTPLAESLRVLAAELRTARVLRIEERAARLPVWLTIPLMTFILPALFFVIGTPVVLRIADFFEHLQIGALH